MDQGSENQGSDAKKFKVLKDIMMAILKRHLSRAAIYAVPPYLLFYLQATVGANSDLAGGRYELFMDEQITFDGIRSILEPDNFFMFMYAIFDGGDQRYGRILWNLGAMAAFVPEKFSGETGQIIATRNLSVILLICSAAILALALGATWNASCTIFIAILSMPFMPYYLTMPKPEPLQLFSISILIYLLVKRDERDTKRVFLLFGICLGIKISSIFVLLPVLIWILRHASFPTLFNQKWIFERVLAFSLGIVIAVPTLLPTMSAITLSLFFWDRLVQNYRYRIVTMPISFLFGGGFSLLIDYLFSVTLHREFLMNYLNYTILGSTHGADSSSVTFLSWIYFVTTEWSPLSATTFLIALISTAVSFVLLAKKSRLRLRVDPVLNVGIAGLTFVFCIFISTHRLWGFYLFLGSTLFLSSIIGIHHRESKVLKETILGKAMFTLQILLLFIFCLNGSRDNFNEFEVSSNRTNSEPYRIQMQSYRTIFTEIEKFSNSNVGELQVALDPNYFQIEQMPNAKIDRFWGPFTDWGKYDLIIVKPSHLGSTPNGAIGTREEAARNTEIENYNKFVVTNSSKCRFATCYIVGTVLPDSGQILIKISP